MGCFPEYQKSAAYEIHTWPLHQGCSPGQSHKLLVTQRICLCASLSVPEAVFHLWIQMASFWKDAPIEVAHRASICLFVFVLYLDQAPVSINVVLSTLLLSPVSWSWPSHRKSQAEVEEAALPSPSHVPVCAIPPVAAVFRVRFHKMVWARVTAHCCQKGMVPTPTPGQSSYHHLW